MTGCIFFIASAVLLFQFPLTKEKKSEVKVGRPYPSYSYSDGDGSEKVVIFHISKGLDGNTKGVDEVNYFLSNDEMVIVDRKVVPGASGDLFIVYHYMGIPVSAPATNNSAVDSEEGVSPSGDKGHADHLWDSTIQPEKPENK